LARDFDRSIIFLFVFFGSQSRFLFSLRRVLPHSAKEKKRNGQKKLSWLAREEKKNSTIQS